MINSFSSFLSTVLALISITSYMLYDVLFYSPVTGAKSYVPTTLWIPAVASVLVLILSINKIRNKKKEFNKGKVFFLLSSIIGISLVVLTAIFPIHILHQLLLLI
jgi:hypothetical protein